MSAWLSWGYLAVIGLAFDAAGAWRVAWALLLRTNTEIGKSAVQAGRVHRQVAIPRANAAELQRSDAWWGVLFFSVGFALQGVPFFVTGNASLDGWKEKVLGLVAVPLAVVLVRESGRRDAVRLASRLPLIGPYARRLIA